MKLNEIQMRDQHIALPETLVVELDRLASEKFLSRASLIRLILLQHVEEQAND